MTTKTPTEHPLRAIRQKRDLTLDALALRAGVGRTTIHTIESGAAIVHTDSLRAVASALGVPWQSVCGPNQAVLARSREEVAELTGDSDVRCACERGHDPQQSAAEWLRGLGLTPDEALDHIEKVEALRNES